MLGYRKVLTSGYKMSFLPHERITGLNNFPCIISFKIVITILMNLLLDENVTLLAWQTSSDDLAKSAFGCKFSIHSGSERPTKQTG